MKLVLLDKLFWFVCHCLLSPLGFAIKLLDEGNITHIYIGIWEGSPVIQSARLDSSVLSRKLFSHPLLSLVPLPGMVFPLTQYCVNTMPCFVYNKKDFPSPTNLLFWILFTADCVSLGSSNKKQMVWLLFKVTMPPKLNIIWGKSTLKRPEQRAWKCLLLGRMTIRCQNSVSSIAMGQ